VHIRFDKRLFNLINYLIAWLSAALGAANGQEDLGAFLAFMIVARHLRLTQLTITDYKIVLASVLIGGAWEYCLIHQHILIYQGASHFSPVPLWVLMQWAALGTTFNHSLKCLAQKYLLSAVIGSLLFPILGYGTEVLAALSIPDQWRGYMILAAGGALLLPLLVFLSRFFSIRTKELPIR
jgi:hypothetical protein